MPYSIGQGTKSGLAASDPFGLLGEILSLFIVQGGAHRAGRSKLFVQKTESALKILPGAKGNLN